MHLLVMVLYQYNSGDCYGGTIAGAISGEIAFCDAEGFTISGKRTEK